jgi:hypothetical protein
MRGWNLAGSGVSTGWSLMESAGRTGLESERGNGRGGWRHVGKDRFLFGGAGGCFRYW